MRHNSNQDSKIKEEVACLVALVVFALVYTNALGIH